MLDQIKFRGQVKTNMLKISKGTFIIAPDDITLECFFRGADVGYIDPATVGRWTVKYDGHNTDVYEGDKIETDEEDRNGVNCSQVGIIKWEIEECAWVVVWESGEVSQLRDIISISTGIVDASVIGNIHEDVKSG